MYGQLPGVRFNLFNLVLAVDLSQTSSLNFLAATVQTLINRGTPFRWGVAPLVETEDGEWYSRHILSPENQTLPRNVGSRMARLFLYLMDNFGPTETFAFITTVRPRLRLTLFVHLTCFA